MDHDSKPVSTAICCRPAREPITYRFWYIWAMMLIMGSIQADNVWFTVVAWPVAVFFSVVGASGEAIRRRP